MYKNIEKEILHLLLENDVPIRIMDIALRLHLSEKTVWNKLHDKRLQTFLNDDVHLEMKSNHGVYLSGSKAALKELKEQLDIFVDYEKVNSDRICNKIILLLAMQKETITMQILMEKFLITKKNLVTYLSDISNRLQKFSLKIEKRQNAGIRIIGDEINIRQMIENTILQQCAYNKQSHHKNTVFDESITEILKELHLDIYLENALTSVKLIQKELLGAFTDEGKKEIVLQILITNQRCQQNHYIEVIKQDIYTSNTQFDQLLKIFEINKIVLRENDYVYLWNRCITNRFSVTAIKTVDHKFLSLSRELLASVIEISQQEDEEVEYLIQNLAFHLSQAVNRSAIGIQVHNPILQKIKLKYGEFYSLVLTNVSRLEKAYQISLNEDEIGFITVYICAIYEKSIANKYYRVLLVSDEGVGQTQLLSMHIVNNFPNLLIHQTSNSLHLSERQMIEADIIVSTCSLSLKKEFQNKYIRISNFIDQQDLQNLSAHLLHMGKIKKTESYEQQKSEHIDFKFFKSNVSSRTELLQLYLQMAEQFGYCDEHYNESVIKREERASTSIGKGVAIPHGDDNHIIRPAVFFVKNEHPIQWGEEYVDIVIFLILKFNSIAENKQFFMQLYSCVSKTELIRQVKDRESLNILERYILEEDSI